MKQKNGQSWIKHIDFMVFDLIAIELAFVLAYLIRFNGADPYAESIWRELALMLPIIDLLVMILGSTYNGVINRGYAREAVAIVKQTLIVMAVLAGYLYVTHSGIDYSRIVVGLTAAFYCVLTMLVRSLWKKFIGRRISRNIRRFILIGDSPLGERFAEAVNNDSTGKLTARFHAAELKELEKLLKRDNSGKKLEVVAALTREEEGCLTDIVDICEKYGVRVDVIPYYADIMSSRACVEQYGDVKLLDFRTTPLDDMTNAMLKRLFDIVSSLFFIILTSPVMLFAAIGTKLSGVKSIIFKQERVGRNRKTFYMYKFRSMRDIGDGDTAWTTDNDKRKTKFGAFLRKFSIDEFPQFFNVLFGQMSLIGPRPEIPHHVEHFIDEIPLYQVRLQVRPGITGWAQVNGLRGDTSIEERVKYDIWYIENWSISLEIKIIFRTVFGGMVNSEKI